jgi:hypothetical protein
VDSQILCFACVSARFSLEQEDRSRERKSVLGKTRLDRKCRMCFRNMGSITVLIVMNVSLIARSTYLQVGNF